MRDLSHSDQIPKQLKSQRSNWQKVNVDVAEASDDMWQPVTKQIMQAWTNTVPTHGMWLVKCGGTTWHPVINRVAMLKM
jgi:hypothetical protein